MVTKPKISIVIPVYNGSDFMQQAIDSALSQTYPETEVLVINDGSSDAGETDRIARTYGNRIRYFSKPNGGVASALNLGINKMSGEYFAWLSHDDIFSYNRCEKDVELFNRYSDIKVTFCNIVTIDAIGRKIKENDRFIEKVTNPREALLLGGIGMCSITIHKSCFEVVGLFNEYNRTTQDTEFILKLSKHFTLFHNRSASTYSREHPGRGTNKLTSQVRNDRLLLSRFIEKEMSIDDFFPDFDPKNQILASESYEWIGDFHRFLGANDTADKYYKFAILDWKRIASKAGIKFILGSRTYGFIQHRLNRLLSKHSIHHNKA